MLYKIIISIMHILNNPLWKHPLLFIYLNGLFINMCFHNGWHPVLIFTSRNSNRNRKVRAGRQKSFDSAQVQTNNALDRLIILARRSRVKVAVRLNRGMKTQTNQNIFATFHYEVKSWGRTGGPTWLLSGAPFVCICICMNNERQIFCCYWHSSRGSAFN